MNQKFKLIAANKFAMILFISVFTSTQSFAATDNPDAFAKLSLEELGNIQITSVSKNKERLIDAAASIYVITGDAIHRYGAQTLPEALRLAPNLQVAQISANQYAISARGFNSSTANKLLVLIDGRAVYTPLYSGVFWDAQDVLMQDIDRIEVISGPGGALWGANAVNGVINIITKKSRDTQGNLASVTGGAKGAGIAMRHGGSFGAEGSGGSGAYRLYGKADDWRNLVSAANGSPTADAWRRRQAGFRADWYDQHNTYTVQGDAYSGTDNQATPGNQDFSGANLLARWIAKMEDDSELRVQGYFDRTTRDFSGILTEKLKTFDLDIQYSLAEKNGSRWTFGGGYRIADDRVGNSAILAFLPPQIDLHWGNLYAQNEQKFGEDWRLTIGAKIETNHYTGVEFMPSIKLAWKFAENKLLWSDLSRAVRTPSRIDTSLFAPATPPYLIAGGPDFRSEVANTFNLGLRAQEDNGLSYSVTAFHSQYTRLRSIDITPGQPFVLGNNIRGLVDGLETWGSYQLNNALAFDASAQYLRERFSGPNLAQSLPGNDPLWQLKVGSKWNINEQQHLDVALRHITKLPNPAVPAYTAVDVSYGWQLSKNIDLMLTGRNIFDSGHQEFSGGTNTIPILIERRFDVALTARF
jgi:iron complex outermembrane receptor protein